MTNFEERLSDEVFRAERRRVWTAKVEPGLKRRFRGYRDSVHGLGPKDVLAAYERAYFLGDLGDPRSPLYLGGVEGFALLPFHCPEFWDRYFAERLPQWERQGPETLQRHLKSHFPICTDHERYGWPPELDLELHRYLYGDRYSSEVCLAGKVLSNPFAPADVLECWALAYAGAVYYGGGTDSPSKWIALYDYWAGVIPMVSGEYFELCDLDGYGSSGPLCSLLWGLANDRVAVQIRRVQMRLGGDEQRGGVLPDYDRMSRDPQRLALMERLRIGLESGALGPDMARLWDQVRAPDYGFYPEFRDGIPDLPPAPRPPARRAAGNPYLQGGQVGIDDLEDPFEMFPDPDEPGLGAHFCNAWKAILALAADELGPVKVTGKRLGDDAYEVRIKTARHTQRFVYKPGEATQSLFYLHLPALAEAEGLAGSFEVDRANEEGQARVSYRREG